MNSSHGDIESGSQHTEQGGDERPRLISFGPDERVNARERAHSRGPPRELPRLTQSHSQARSVSSLPVEFHRLSFQISESEARSDKKAERHRKKAEKEKRKKEKKDRENVEDVSYFESLNFHCLSTTAVCNDLGTPDNGLSSSEASTRLQRDGRNTLPQRRQNYVKRILKYIFGGFCSVLWIGVIIFFICWRPLGDPNPAAYNLGLAILVLIVIFLQASFSAFQDWSTARTMAAILDLIPADAFAIRDGQTLKIPSTDLVVGDLVKISVGNKVPADIRLLETSGDVRFDRSLLTGESDEVDGTTEMTDSNFLETHNMALMGTLVTNGSATGVVVLTGKHTVMGHVAVASTSVDDEPTLIQREITRFVMIIVCMTVCLALLLLFTWVGWLRVDHRGYMSVVAMLNNVMGCVVAFIPEGMPVGVALTLLRVASRMKDNRILPKGLSTVETLGCVNVICSDKTGTLTENRMTVVTASFVDRSLPVDEAVAASSSSPALKELHRAATLCNDATFDAETIDQPVMQRKILGNATDGAALKFAATVQAESPSALNPVDYPRVFTIPFNSKNKWMLTLHKTSPTQKDTSNLLMLVKGASDILLPHCTSYWSYATNTITPLDKESRRQLAANQETMSRGAQRVILLCQRSMSPVHSLETNAFADEIHASVADLTLIGMLGILDPPRPEAASTVAACRRAGARFFMVTGDLGLTGAAIARDIGIFTGTAEPDTFDTIVQHRISNSSPPPPLPPSPPHLPTDTSSSLEKPIDSTSSKTALLLEGPSISELTAEDWDTVCSYQEIVFGRTMPEQKLRIVNEFRARDNVVAVTGDGVNDAPAMRAADVGIAVVTGSDVALEAADLILLDKFDSIVEAIRLGRLVFQNLQKLISYLLPAGSWSEIWPVLLNVFLGVPLPLSSFLMIIICVFTDLFCALSLIMEEEEFDLLDLPPRNHKRDHLINLKVYAQSYLFIGVMETIIAHSMYFFYYWRHAKIPVSALFLAFEKYSAGFYGYSQEELDHFNVTGQSVYFITLVFLQWGNLLSVRNKRQSILQADPIRKKRRNPWLLGGMVVSLAIAIFVTEEPGLQRIFGTGSAPLEFWFLPIPLALGILFMDEIRKLIVRVWPRGPLARIAW